MRHKPKGALQARPGPGIPNQLCPLGGLHAPSLLELSLFMYSHQVLLALRRWLPSLSWEEEMRKGVRKRFH